VQIEVKQAEREVHEKSQPTFDVMRIMNDSEVPTLYVHPFSHLPATDLEGTPLPERSSMSRP
jgi:hypothetical protein